jgi:rSAM/selenodomain-associated transferase 1
MQAVSGTRAIVIVAKAPAPGQTKTRLAPPLTFEDAAALYQAFLLDTVDAALAVGWERVTIVHPHQSGVAQALRQLVPSTAALQPQRGVGLGDALSSAFESQFDLGFDRVVLIAGDTPTLPLPVLDRASEALERHDVAIGPSADGGYYLLGLRSFQPGLFQGISWSTEVVFEQTLAKAAELDLAASVLPEWYDVDTVAELRRLVDELESLPLGVAQKTRATLATFDLYGLPVAL